MRLFEVPIFKEGFKLKPYQTLTFATAKDNAIWLLRAGLAVFGQIKSAGLDYRAMSLVYTSLLALIPLLAVCFSMLKAFGADAYLELMLVELLKPLQGSSASAAATLLDSVRKLDVGVLGSVGLLSLLYTSVSLLDKIEDSFNHIWRKRASVPRSLLRRFSDYLFFILVGPLLVFSAFGGMSELFRRASEFDWFEGAVSPFIAVSQAALPAVFVAAAFAFFYQIIPDAPVKIRSALFGGLIAGLSWKAVGWVFGNFMAGSAQYPAVYSTFAILILFMVWLYLSWLIVLLGVQVTFFHQYPRYLFLRNGEARLSGRLSERLGLLAMVLVGRRFFLGEPPWSGPELTARLALPDDCVDELLQILAGHGFIMLLAGEPGLLIPARDLATIKVVEVLDALRSAHEGEFPLVAESLAEPAVDALADRLDNAMREIVGEQTIRDLIVEHGTC
jgi:membrane protein